MLNVRITDADVGASDAHYYFKNVDRYAARGVLFFQSGKVAMLYMRGNGFYKLPGGGIEAGEDCKAAFLREVEEETGCHCEIVRALGTIEEHKRRTGFCQRSFCYLARVTDEVGVRAYTPSERRLGMELHILPSNDALHAMERSLEQCRDYRMRFMLLRDLTILRYVIHFIK